MYKTLITGILLFSAAFSVSGQEISRPAYWVRYSNESNWGKASFQVEIDNRRFLQPHTQLQFISRLSANFKFHSWMSAGLGFAYSNATIRPFGLFVPEFRPHQEVLLTHPVGRLELSHRIRFEQQYTRDSLEQKLLDETMIALRLRYRLQANYDLKAKSREKGHLGFLINTENFLTHQEGNLKYSEFRVYAGVQHQPFAAIAFELGYMYLLEMNRIRPDIRYNTLRLTLRHFIDWE
jgi:hypothetical protein